MFFRQPPFLREMSVLFDLKKKKETWRCARSIITLTTAKIAWLMIHRINWSSIAIFWVTNFTRKKWENVQNNCIAFSSCSNARRIFGKKERITRTKEMEKKKKSNYYVSSLSSFLVLSFTSAWCWFKNWEHSQVQKYNFIF